MTASEDAQGIPKGLPGDAAMLARMADDRRGLSRRARRRPAGQRSAARGPPRPEHTTPEDAMIGPIAALIYGLASSLVFFLSFVSAVAFIGNYPVAKSIDVGSESGLVQSVLIDLALLGTFAVQHSVMARPAFKRWWTTIVPATCERATYVL